MKGRYIFGRAAIAAAVLLWIINALMWYTGSDNVVEAFTSNAEQYGNARIIAQGNMVRYILMIMPKQLYLRIWQIKSERSDTQ